MDASNDMPINVTLTDLEQAINYWRVLRPSTGEERALSPEVNVLATSYALMIFNGVKSVPRTALDQVTLQLLERSKTSAV